MNIADPSVVRSSVGTLPPPANDSSYREESLPVVTGGHPAGWWTTVTILCVMGAILCAVLCLPVRRLSAHIQIQYNEGWNAYKQTMAAEGVPLYGHPRMHLIGGTGYPPLSFHVIGTFGQGYRLVMVGRWMSLVSFLVAGILVGLIVQHVTQEPLTAWFAFLLYEVGIVLLGPDRIGMNDPQLFAEALCASGFYAYLKSGRSAKLLCLSAVLFCLAGFTKQNMLAFPLAVAIELFASSRRRFFIWTASVLGSASLFLAFTLWVDGPFVVAHLGAIRSYSIRGAWAQTRHYVTMFQIALMVAAAWSIRAIRVHTSVVCAFWSANIFAFLLAGGDGVVLNIFFNAFMSTVIACGLAVSEFAARVAPRFSLTKVQGVLMLGVFFGVCLEVPTRLRSDLEQIRELHSQEAEFGSSLEFIKARNGPALCETLLLCYEANKALEYDPFSVMAQLKTGWLREEEVNQLLRVGYFKTIEVDVPTEQANQASENISGERFTATFMRELWKRYSVAMRTSQAMIFVPK